jgi:hypothetical protein
MILALSLRYPFAAWRKVAPANALRVALLCAGFGALLVAAVSYVREPAAGPQAAGFAGLGRIAGQGASGRGLAVDVASDDPVARFSATRIGHILYSPYDGDYCRRVLFDNHTGALYENGNVICVQVVQQAEPLTGTDRLLALRKAFQR